MNIRSFWTLFDVGNVVYIYNNNVENRYLPYPIFKLPKKHKVIIKLTYSVWRSEGKMLSEDEQGNMATRQQKSRPGYYDRPNRQ